MGLRVDAGQGWEDSFVATTVALGDSVDDARRSLARADARAPAPLWAGLAHPERNVRARTLAAALGRIIVDLEQARVV